MQKAEVVNVRAGLRPSRRSVRLELEWRHLGRKRKPVSMHTCAVCRVYTHDHMDCRRSAHMRVVVQGWSFNERGASTLEAQSSFFWVDGDHPVPFRCRWCTTTVTAAGASRCTGAARRTPRNSCCARSRTSSTRSSEQPSARNSRTDQRFPRTSQSFSRGRKQLSKKNCHGTMFILLQCYF